MLHEGSSSHILHHAAWLMSRRWVDGSNFRSPHNYFAKGITQISMAGI